MGRPEEQLDFEGCIVDPKRVDELREKQMDLFEEYVEMGERPSERQVGGEHYKDMKIQPTTFIELNSLGWCEGNAVKYICRHAIKHENGEKDILKAIHYLELLLETRYAYVRTKDTIA